MLSIFINGCKLNRYLITIHSCTMEWKRALENINDVLKVLNLIILNIEAK